MPDAAMESEHEEEEEEYNDSPVKQKAASKPKSNGKAPAKKQDGIPCDSYSFLL